MPPRILLFCVTPLENESLFRKAYSRIDSYRQKRVDRYAKEEDKLHSEADLVEADTSKILAQGIDEDPDKELKKNLMY